MAGGRIAASILSKIIRRPLALRTGRAYRIELSEETANVGCSERQKEIKRRRHRRKKMAQLATRAKKATVSEKSVIAHKVRGLTPGAEDIITAWGLEAR